MFGIFKKKRKNQEREVGLVDKLASPYSKIIIIVRDSRFCEDDELLYKIIKKAYLFLMEKNFRDVIWVNDLALNRNNPSTLHPYEYAKTDILNDLSNNLDAINVISGMHIKMEQKRAYLEISEIKDPEEKANAILQKYNDCLIEEYYDKIFDSLYNGINVYENEGNRIRGDWALANRKIIDQIDDPSLSIMYYLIDLIFDKELRGDYRKYLDSPKKNIDEINSNAFIEEITIPLISIISNAINIVSEDGQVFR